MDGRIRADSPLDLDIDKNEENKNQLPPPVALLIYEEGDSRPKPALSSEH